MADIDNINAITRLDSEGMLQKTLDLPNQIERCWHDFKTLGIPTYYINAKSVLILGMGGSAIGGALAASLAKTRAKIPVSLCRDYEIPAWVDRNTLVIGVSFSGNTEETLIAFAKAAKITEKLITISTGGELASLGSRYKAFHYQINYSSQPRAALGFSLTALLAIFNKLKIMEITDEEIAETVHLMKDLIAQIEPEVKTPKNNAKLLAQRIFGKIPIVLGAEIMAEVARRWKGHFNENAKNASYFEELPEMNHNALVGLEYPSDLGKKVFFILLESKFNNPRNRLRHAVTAQILQKRRIAFESVLMEPSGKAVAEMFKMILFGDFVSYYLAILNNVSPDPVDIVDFLKEKLAEVDGGVNV